MFKSNLSRLMLMLMVGGGALSAVLIAGAANLQQQGPAPSVTPATQNQGASLLPVTPPSFEVLDVLQQLTVTVLRNDRSGFDAKATVFIRNLDDKKIKVTKFYIVAQNEAGETYTTDIKVDGGPGEMEPRTVKAFQLDIKSDQPLPPFGNDPDDVPHALTGHLAVEAERSMSRGRDQTRKLLALLKT